MTKTMTIGLGKGFSNSGPGGNARGSVEKFRIAVYLKKNKNKNCKLLNKQIPI